MSEFLPKGRPPKKSIITPQHRKNATRGSVIVSKDRSKKVDFAAARPKLVF